MPLPNPFGDGQALMEVPADVSEILFNKLLYLKKLIEDTASSEETIRLLRVSLFPLCNIFKRHLSGFPLLFCL